MAYLASREKRVNSFTDDNQSMPAVARLSDGGWVVSWASYGQDGDEYGIYRQRYDSDGRKVGNEKHVGTATDDTQFQPAVSALSGGGWIETWTAYDPDTLSLDIHQQAFGADGKAIVPVKRVNETTPAEQSHSSVTALKDGGWVVTWNSEDSGDGTFDVLQRAFHATGEAIGGETHVTSFTTSDQFDAEVAALDTGGWVVTWSSYGHAADPSAIFQQVFAADGTALGDEARVNSHKAGNQYRPVVATLKDGSYVVSWESQDQDGSGYGIYQQRFAEDGHAIGGERRVNTYVKGDQDHADIAALSNGGWVEVWQSDGEDGSGYGIYGRVFDADGSADGKAFRINQHRNSEQKDPTVTALDHGRFVVAWQSYDVDGSEGAVMQRVFRPGSARAAEDAIDIVIRPPVISGTGKGDRLEGKDIAEIFRGRGGDDVIVAGGGNDRLDGGKDDDLLIGGEGSDTFIFKTGYGHDRIRGFFEGDRIDLSQVDSIKDFDDLIANHTFQFGADIMIDAGNGDSLMIGHGNLGLLQASDFKFD